MLERMALFINGVYESALDEVLKVQNIIPEHIMYLQPYAGSAIKKLEANPPTIEHPVKLYLSITTDLSHVHYVAEIVGWDDKRTLSKEKRQLVEKLINFLQENEGGLYNVAKGGTGESVNLLSIRRLQKLEEPFSVSRLRKLEDGQPLSENRTTAGGWSYVDTELIS